MNIYERIKERENRKVKQSVFSKVKDQAKSLIILIYFLFAEKQESQVR